MKYEVKGGLDQSIVRHININNASNLHTICYTIYKMVGPIVGDLPL